MEGVSVTVALVGIALVVAALVGGGVKLAGTEIPILNTWERQVAVGLVGIAILAFAWVTRADFRVVSVSTTADQASVTLCPATVSYTGVIEVAGGKGDVEFRFVHNGTPTVTQSLPFEKAGSRSVSAKFEVTSLPGLPRLGPDAAYLEVVAPNHVTSSIAETQVLC